MSKKVLIDEGLFDNLLLKSLPQEYEVLSYTYKLKEDEEEYLLILLSLFYEIIESTRKWVLSFKGINNLEDLDIFFFDEMDDEINDLFKTHFESIVLLLGMFYDTGKNVAVRELNVTLVPYVNESLLLSIIKHHNYQVINNIIKDISKNLRDIVWNGIKDKLDIDEIAENLLKKGLQPIGKFTPQQRARMIAVTERSRAYNSAKLQTYHNYGVKYVDIITAHDSKVCSICWVNESNNPYSIEEAQDIIPSHPYCRCEYFPHFDDEKYVDDLIPEDFVVDLTNY